MSKHTPLSHSLISLHINISPTVPQCIKQTHTHTRCKYLIGNITQILVFQTSVVAHSNTSLTHFTALHMTSQWSSSFRCKNTLWPLMRECMPRETPPVTTELWQVTSHICWHEDQTWNQIRVLNHHRSKSFC